MGSIGGFLNNVFGRARLEDLIEDVNMNDESGFEFCTIEGSPMSADKDDSASHEMAILPADIFPQLVKTYHEIDDRGERTRRVIDLVNDKGVPFWSWKGKLNQNNLPPDAVETIEIYGMMMSRIGPILPRLLAPRVECNPTNVLHPTEHMAIARPTKQINPEEGKDISYFSNLTPEDEVDLLKLGFRVTQLHSTTSWPELHSLLAEFMSLPERNITEGEKGGFCDSSSEHYHDFRVQGVKMRLDPATRGQDVEPSLRLQFSDDDFKERIYAAEEIGRGILWQFAQQLLARFAHRYFEHPEHYLHPKAAADLAESLFDRTPFCLIETHAEAILLRMQRLVRDRRMLARDARVLVFQREEGQNKVRSIPIAENGDLLCEFPDGFAEVYWSERE